MQNILIDVAKVIRTYTDGIPSTYATHNSYAIDCKLVINADLKINVIKDNFDITITATDNNEYTINNEYFKFINQSNELFNGYNICFKESKLTITRHVGKVCESSELLSEIFSLDGLILNLRDLLKTI